MDENSDIHDDASPIPIQPTPYASCADCRHLNILADQPNGLPHNSLAGMCMRYPPTVQLRPQQIQPSLLQEGIKPQASQVVMVPSAYYPPVLSSTPACGELRVRMGVRKREKKRLRAV